MLSFPDARGCDLIWRKTPEPSAGLKESFDSSIEFEAVGCAYQTGLLSQILANESIALCGATICSLGTYTALAALRVFSWTSLSAFIKDGSTMSSI